MTLDRLQKTIDFYRKLQARTKEQIDQLAVKMGVDPDADFLIIPLKWCIQYGWRPAEFPRWLKASEYAKQGYLVKGVRERLSIKKGI